jgi:hypothetical protein
VGQVNYHQQMLIQLVSILLAASFAINPAVARDASTLESTLEAQCVPLTSVSIVQNEIVVFSIEPEAVQTAAASLGIAMTTVKVSRPIIERTPLTPAPAAMRGKKSVYNATKGVLSAPSSESFELNPYFRLHQFDGKRWQLVAVSRYSTCPTSWWGLQAEREIAPVASNLMGTAVNGASRFFSVQLPPEARQGWFKIESSSPVIPPAVFRLNKR